MYWDCFALMLQCAWFTDAITYRLFVKYNNYENFNLLICYMILIQATVHAKGFSIMDSSCNRLDA